eukprot:CAMPEP_0113373338 /NCGR_PEP_ID=MMETSP0013_2-20120614/1009_1 /TAXON_ID=2843 ORGANISM="Skeletonema costatum, Strain 1716" /NCGR_SAMPLE_ID=MMETSP0013_2 /ASSEMBLY_ACC=CAM_ASM_000158 /LENGTH=436 /DNA_ID=CAMNT_0000255279 /DNA_START=74 /DNA_END=1384 /DNA_ORIENTATION=- /assembly_acc=CAM_ASM_000158
MDRRRRLKLNRRQRQCQRFPQLHRICLFFLLGVSVLLQILLITRTEHRSENDLPPHKNHLNAASSTQHGKHNDENEKNSATTTKSRPPRLFSVFSTECSPFHDWHAQSLIHNHKKQGIQGFLVRLMACDDPSYILPKHSYEKYRVVRLPNFGLRGGDNWSVRNKPFSVAYWLGGFSKDDDLPEDDDIVASIDPDMLFLSSDVNLGSIKENHGVASQYSLGNEWVTKDWVLKLCDGKCDVIADPSDVSFGAPYILRAKDMLRLARLWKSLVDEMRPYDKSWHLDMYAAIIAARRLDIVFTVERGMIGNPIDDMEPWDLTTWGGSSSDIGKLHSHDPLTMQVVHYCQTYSISSYSWGKHDYHNLDIRKCDPLNNAFNMPTTGDSILMTETRGKELAPMTDVATTARNVWLLDATMAVAHEAIERYNSEFCVPLEHTKT